MQAIIIIIIGFVAGILSGAIGIGGGIILVPALVYFLGYTQQMAQGTTLMLLAMPVVGLAVYQYYKSGNVQFGTALWLALGFVIGGYFGGYIANQLPAETLKKVFGFIILFIAIKMILGK